MMCLLCMCLNFRLSFSLMKGLGVFMKQRENQLHFISSSYQLQESGMNPSPRLINCHQICDQRFADVNVTCAHSTILPIFNKNHQIALGHDCCSKTAKVEPFSKLILCNKRFMFGYEYLLPHVLLEIVYPLFH